jgi:hypothetical protein
MEIPFFILYLFHTRVRIDIFIFFAIVVVPRSLCMKEELNSPLETFVH